MNISYELFGEQALFVRFSDTISPDTFTTIQSLLTLLEQNKPHWLIEYVPAYTNVCLYFDLVAVMQLKKPNETITHFIAQYIEQLLTIKQQTAPTSRHIQIPVVYGDEFGPDLAHVAAYNQLTHEQVIEKHTSRTYLVYMIGFAPGFAFMGGMDEAIATPRKDSPRARIPIGSVGIAGAQTGIYPLETPGGWQLIGRTPLALFRSNDTPPSYLRAGDTVTFKAITKQQYEEELQ